MLDNILKSFDHPAFHRVQAWDLRQVLSTAQFVAFIDDADIQDLIRNVHQTFNNYVLPDSSEFSWSVLMGDCNDSNVIINPSRQSGAAAVQGFIDFGDAVYSWTVNDVAIAICYALTTEYGRQNVFETIGYILCGYLATCPTILSHCELKHLQTLIACRLSISISVGAYSIAQDPTNEYLKLHALPARQALRLLLSIDSLAFEEFISKLLTLAVNVGENQQQRDFLSASGGLQLSSGIDLQIKNLIQCIIGTEWYIHAKVCVLIK